MKTSTELITVFGVLKFQSELDGLGYTLTFTILLSFTSADAGQTPKESASLTPAVWFLFELPQADRSSWVDVVLLYHKYVNALDGSTITV